MHQNQYTMKWYADKIKIVDLKGLIYRLVDQTLIFFYQERRLWRWE